MKLNLEGIYQMIDDDRISFGISLLEMKCSLDEAVKAAGGDSTVVCSLYCLRNMTAFELLCHLAANNIRFEHVHKTVHPVRSS